jgi:hypothetical protein
MKIQVNSWVQMRQLWFKICHLMPMLYVSDICTETGPDER